MCGQKVLPYIFLARSSSFYIYHDIWRSSFSFKYKKRVMGHGWCWGRSVVGVSRVILCLLETFLCADWYRAFFKHFFLRDLTENVCRVVSCISKTNCLCSVVRWGHCVMASQPSDYGFKKILTHFNHQTMVYWNNLSTYPCQWVSDS